MMLYSTNKTTGKFSLLLSIALSTNLIATTGNAAPNNAPSFTPGIEPASSACDGEYRMSEWAQDVTDNDGGTSGLSFHITEVTNSHIFSKPPHVSWPSKTLSYELKPGTPGDIVATVTAVLKDTSGTGQGGRDTSDPQSWNIYTTACANDTAVHSDQDGDGISDGNEGSGVLDTDGDGIPDSQDTDSDNDGIPDIDENTDTDQDGIRDSEEPNGNNVSTDTDNDGVIDEIDIDDDNDGIIDSIEGYGLIDTDNDLLPDTVDLDSDNDGLSDLIESGADLSQLTYSDEGSLTNTVSVNGLVDLLETSIDSGLPILPPKDSNNDGIADFQQAAGDLLSYDPGTPAINDDQGTMMGTVMTGLNGGGCTLTESRAFDPTIMLSALIAFIALWRRKLTTARPSR